MNAQTVDRSQCPTCGRLDVDYADPETRDGAGALKFRQHKGTEDRLAAYRTWRWKMATRGSGCFVTDVDQLEYRVVDSRIIPVALLELTRVDGNRPVPPTYLEKILQRFVHRDGQGRVAVELANRLGVKAGIVAYRHDLTEFWVYNLSDNHKPRWYHYDQVEYERWLRQLQPAAASEVVP